MRNIVVVACIILLIGVLYIRKSRYKSQRGGEVNPLIIGGLCVSVVVGGLVIAYFANDDFKNKIDGIFGSENTIQTPTGCATHMTEAACPSPCEWNVDECSEPTPLDPDDPMDPIDSYKTPYYNSNYWPSSCSPPPAGTSTTECTDPCRIDSITDPSTGVHTCTIGGHPVAMMGATSSGCADGYALVDLNKVPKTWTTETSVSSNLDSTAGANPPLADHSTSVVGVSGSNAYVVQQGVGPASYRQANPNAKLACRLMCGCGPKSNIYKYMDTPEKIFSSNTWLTPGADTQNKIGDYASSSRVTCSRDISLIPDISDTSPNPMTYEYNVNVTKPTDNTVCDSVSLTTAVNHEDKKKKCVDHHCVYDQRHDRCSKPNFPKTQWCKSIPSTSDYGQQELPNGLTSNAIYPSGSESLRSIAPSPRVGRCTCTHGYPKEHHNCRGTEEKCAACKPGFLLDTDNRCHLRCGFRIVHPLGQDEGFPDARDDADLPQPAGGSGYMTHDWHEWRMRPEGDNTRCEGVRNTSEGDDRRHTKSSKCCPTSHGDGNDKIYGVKCCSRNCAHQEHGCENEDDTAHGYFAGPGADYDPPKDGYTPSHKGLIN